MDKIVLVCQKKDDRLDNLIKCLKYLFPECSVELRSTNKKFYSSEKEDRPASHNLNKKQPSVPI